MYSTYLIAGFAALGQATADRKQRSEGDPTHASPNAARWKRSTEGSGQMLHRRQDPPRPPYTEYPVCDDEDGYFYVTEFGNMTFQIQCTTTYLGGQDNYTPADDLFGCIDYCASLNAASRGSCLGVNWNAPFVGSGDCFTFSSIIDALPAFEGGGYQEAALLIEGGDGTIYATPRPFVLPSSTEAGASSTETTSSASSTLATEPPTTINATSSSLTSTVAQPSISTGSPAASTGASTGASGVNIDPGLGSTTTGSTSISFVLPTTSSSWTCSTSTTTVTSRMTLTGCLPGANCGTLAPALSTTPSTSTATSVLTTGTGLTTTAFTTSVRPPTTGPNGQVTAFEAIPITVFEVQPLLICDPSGRCLPSAQVDTIVSIRTGLRCSPDVCSGDTVDTQVDALFAAPTCVLRS